MSWYSWDEYENILLQGDILFNCPVLPINLALEEPVVESDFDVYDVILLTQSCDLNNDKTGQVLVAPLLVIEDFYDQGKIPGKGKRLEKLTSIEKRREEGLLLLNKCERNGEQIFDYKIVSFRMPFAVSFSTIASLCKVQIPRLRLSVPYREFVASEFGRYYSRIALPIRTEAKEIPLPDITGAAAAKAD